MVWGWIPTVQGYGVCSARYPKGGGAGGRYPKIRVIKIENNKPNIFEIATPPLQ